MTLSEFCEQWYGWVHYYIRQRVNDPDDVWDLTQTVFEKVVKGWDSWSFMGYSRKCWLKKIMDNAVVDFWRHNAHTVKTTPFAEEAVAHDDEEEYHRPHSAAEMDLVTPESVLLDYHDRQATLNLLGTLTEKQQLTMFCRFLLHYSLNETGDAVGTTQGGAKALQWRACEALKVGLTEGDLQWIDVS